MYKRLFGFSSLLVPVITAISGLLFIDAIKTKIKELRVIIGLVLLLLALSGFFHIFISNNVAKQAALEGKGGGFIGYLIANSLESTISIYGGVLVLLAIVIASIILIFNISFDQILEFYKEKLSTLKIFNFSKKSNDEITISESSDLDDGLVNKTDNSAISGVEDAAVQWIKRLLK